MAFDSLNVVIFAGDIWNFSVITSISNQFLLKISVKGLDRLFPHCGAGITDTANAMICSGAGKASEDDFPAPQSSREYGVPRPLGWCQQVST